jgi:hypothetical protein
LKEKKNKKKKKLTWGPNDNECHLDLHCVDSAHLCHLGLFAAAVSLGGGLKGISAVTVVVIEERGEEGLSLSMVVVREA